MNEIIIGDRVITEATEQAAVLLDRYRAQINQTYLDGDGAAQITLRVTLEVGGNLSNVGVETTISFTCRKIRDVVMRRYVSETQGALDF